MAGRNDAIYKAVDVIIAGGLHGPETVSALVNALDVEENKKKAALLDTVELLDSLLTVLGKNTPLGVLANVGELKFYYDEAREAIDKNGEIENSTINNLLSAFVTLAPLLAVGSVPVLATASIAAAALTTLALLSEKGDTLIQDNVLNLLNVTSEAIRPQKAALTDLIKGLGTSFEDGLTKFTTLISATGQDAGQILNDYEQAAMEGAQVLSDFMQKTKNFIDYLARAEPQNPRDMDDYDGDGIPNVIDNDLDGDGLSNEIDKDIDNDGILNENDERPYDPRTLSDLDGDGLRNEYDTDMDGDGAPNWSDKDIDGDKIDNDIDDRPYDPRTDDDIDGDREPNWSDKDIDGDGKLNEDDDDPANPRDTPPGDPDGKGYKNLIPWPSASPGVPWGPNPENPIGASGGAGGEPASGPVNRGAGGAGRVMPRRDPLVVDLDGDGVELINLDDSEAYFDLNNDGFATQTAWLSGDDGFLVIDRNADGTINNINELFGSPERTGYDELAELDSNKDGLIDAGDSRFAELKIWQDKNGDGVSQADELRTLSEIGIKSINLDFQNVSGQSGDAQLARKGSFRWEDGTVGLAAETTGIVGDVLFATDSTYSKYVGNVESDPEVAAVSNIKGYGQIPDLHIAMNLDVAFRTYVLDLLDNITMEALIGKFDEFLVKWAGVEGVNITDIDPEHRLNVNTETGKVDFRLAGESFTLQQLGVLKQYVGIDSLALGDGQWRENGQIVTTGSYYREGYNVLTRNLLIKMAVANGLVADTMPGLTYNLDTDRLEMVTEGKGGTFGQAMDNIAVEAYNNLASALRNQKDILKHWIGLTALGEIEPRFGALYENALKQLIGDIGGQGILNVIDDSIKVSWDALVGNNTITTGSFADHIDAGVGDDTIKSGSGDDTLRGGIGNDNLFGGDGDDLLLGGIGNDILEGGLGDDRIFGGSGDDLIIDLGTGNNTLLGGSGNDTITYSRTSNNTIDGGSGNDHIKVDNVSYAKDTYSNTIMGGTGNDHIETTAGNDTYIFNRGDGHDTIRDYGNGYYSGNGFDKLVLGEGIQLSDLSASRVGNHLVLRIADPSNPGVSDQITIEEWFVNVNYQIEEFEFEDGIVLTGGELLVQLPVSTFGTSANDSLNGYEGDDILIGGKGRDILTGKNGNDQFVFDTIPDESTNRDTITDFSANQDKIVLNNSIFTSLVEEGILTEANFNASTSGVAADENDYILYNTSSGALLYDADGSGQGVAVDFAQLTTKPELTAKDFMIVS